MLRLTVNGGEFELAFSLSPAPTAAAAALLWCLCCCLWQESERERDGEGEGERERDRSEVGEGEACFGVAAGVGVAVGVGVADGVVCRLTLPRSGAFKWQLASTQQLSMVRARAPLQHSGEGEFWPVIGVGVVVAFEFVERLRK